MNEPDDFGLSPSHTLAHVGDPTPPPGFVQFWFDWTERVWADEPDFEPANPARADAPGATEAGAPHPPGLTHVFRSSGGVRIGCRLTEPRTGSIKGVVVTSHGYKLPPGQPLDGAAQWAGRDVAVVELRLRGFPGSQADTGDLTRHATGYATIGLEDRPHWILFHAVADIVNAVRASRRKYGVRVPVSLHGDSFGGGLAVVAASLLSAQGPVSRLALALPSLGCWGWRLAHPATRGTGMEVARYLDAHRGLSDAMRETLRFIDSVVHARRVVCPVLCKVAARDDVVPAPAAAAVYNALGTDPGLKWRFATTYGHFDGGLADRRRHAMFERLIGDFLDPTIDPVTLMHDWEPLLLGGDRPPTEPHS